MKKTLVLTLLSIISVSALQANFWDTVKDIIKGTEGGIPTERLKNIPQKPQKPVEVSTTSSTTATPIKNVTYPTK